MPMKKKDAKLDMSSVLGIEFGKIHFLYMFFRIHGVSVVLLDVLIVVDSFTYSVNMLQFEIWNDFFSLFQQKPEHDIGFVLFL